MKTLQELYNEVIKSDELKKAYLEAVKNKNIRDFLKSHGCEATAEEFKTFLIEQAKKNTDKELSVDELENVAGGNCNGVTSKEVEMSCLTFGIACATIAIDSAITGHAGQEMDSEGRLCSEWEVSDYNKIWGSILP